MFKWFRQIKNFLFKKQVEIKAIPKSAMKIYIESKIYTARKAGWINPIEQELEFIKNHEMKSPSLDSLKKYDVVYKPDTFGAHEKVQWDYQFDSITTFKRGGGDCNSLNRIAQAYATTKGYEAFLVTYVATEIEKNHTTCIMKKNDFYHDYDYGITHSTYDTLEDAIDGVAKRYGTSTIEYVVQDIAWNFVDD